MQKPSLDQILATIPPPKRRTLDQKVSDIHLAEIARAVTDWRSVCPHLGITEGEEAAIEGNIDVRRYANCVFVSADCALFLVPTGNQTSCTCHDKNYGPPKIGSLIFEPIFLQNVDFF